MKSGFRRTIFSLLVKRFLPVRTNGVDRRLRTTSAAILKQSLESMPNESIPVFTIGFTKKGAAQFFEKLRANDVRRVVDVRLNNVSQLAGFSKRDDLKYFLKQVLDVEYVEAPLLAPTQQLLDAYKKNKGRWEDYERDFLRLMEERKIEEKIEASLLVGGCLLCSEDKPHHCHRRLVVDYLQRRWGNLAIQHIV